MSIRGWIDWSFRAGVWGCRGSSQGGRFKTRLPQNPLTVGIHGMQSLDSAVNHEWTLEWICSAWSSLQWDARVFIEFGSCLSQNKLCALLVLRHPNGMVTCQCGVLCICLIMFSHTLFFFGWICFFTRYFGTFVDVVIPMLCCFILNDAPTIYALLHYPTHSKSPG